MEKSEEGRRDLVMASESDLLLLKDGGLEVKCGGLAPDGGGGRHHPSSDSAGAFGAIGSDLREQAGKGSGSNAES